MSLDSYWDRPSGLSKKEKDGVYHYMEFGRSWVRKGWQRDLLILCLFIVLGMAVYWNAFDNPFCSLDDPEYVERNLNIRQIENIPRFFLNPRLSTRTPHYTGHYRPFVTTSYAIDYALGGLNPVGYHLVNLSFHIGSAFLIFLIVQAMLGGSGGVAAIFSLRPRGAQVSQAKACGYSLPAALAAGLIFLVHPFNSEAVNYITARSSLMSGFFYLLAFYCWVRYRNVAANVATGFSLRPRGAQVSQAKACGYSCGYGLRDQGDVPRNPETSSGQAPKVAATPYYIASLLAFVAGMLSKEVLITLPIVLWLYDIYFGPNYGRMLKPAATSLEVKPVATPAYHGRRLQPAAALRSYVLDWRAYLAYLPFMLVVVLPYLIIRVSSFGRVLPHFRRDLGTQILTSLPVLVRHWAMFLFPRGLSVFHDVEIYREVTWTVFFSGLALLLYVGVTIFLTRRRQTQWRMVSFFMIWFLMVLLPMIIIPLNQILRESRGYLAIVSFAVLAGIIIRELGRRFRPISAGLIILLAVVYSLGTFQRNIVWGNDLLLWKDAVEKAPGSPVTYAGLSAAYMRRGDTFLALETVQKGLSIAPGNYFLLVNLGDSYQLMGDIDRAIKAYQKAIIVNPRQAIVWKEVAVLYQQKGEMEKAELYLRDGMKIRNDYPPLYYHLGVVLHARGKFNDAVEMYRQAIRLYPEYFKARSDLAKALEQIGRRGEAADQYREIVHLASRITDLRSLVFEQDQETLKRIIKEARERLSQNTEYRYES